MITKTSIFSKKTHIQKLTMGAWGDLITTNWKRFKMNKKGRKRLKKVFQPAFGCLQDPKFGRNIQQTRNLFGSHLFALNISWFSRPQDPPPYTEAGGRAPRRASVHGSMVDTPPPEYRSQEGLNRVQLTQADLQGDQDGSRRQHHHHHHHRRHHSRHTGPQTPKNGGTSATESLLGGGRSNDPPLPGHEGCNPRTTVEAEICAYNLCWVTFNIYCAIETAEYLKRRGMLTYKYRQY